MEKIHISNVQVFMLGITSITATGHLLFIPVVLSHSGRDSWIALLIAAIPAVLAAYVTSALTRRHPGQTIIEYSESILGKWLGRCMGLLFIFYFFHDATISIRGFGEFFTTAVTPNTPILVYMSCIVILAAHAIRNGLELLARTNQMFLTMMIPIGVLASILTHKDKDYHNFLPILSNGIGPIGMGVLSLLSLYSTFIVLSMVLPYVENTQRLPRYGVMTMLILIVMFMGPITGPVAVFGGERATGLSFPTFQILRDIKVGQVQRLDFIGIFLWSLGSFGKISLFLYACCTGLAKLLRIPDYRTLVNPVSILLVIVSLFNAENYLELFQFLRNIFPYYSTFIGLLLPCLLLIISKARRLKT